MKRQPFVAPALSKLDKEILGTAEAFVKKAIVAGRKPPYKGIHAVYSGLNNAMKTVFPGCNPVAITDHLGKTGKIVVIPRKGGVMLYLPEDAPKVDTGGGKLLEAMGVQGAKFAL
jgi:hypothetical protein